MSGLVASHGQERRTVATWLAGHPPLGLLWPIGLAIGIGVYAGLAREPPVALLWAAAAVLAVLLAAAVWLRGRWLIPVLGGLALVGGVAAAMVETQRVMAPMIDWRSGPSQVEGHVAAVEALAGGRHRVVIAEPAGIRLAPEETPRAVRIRLVPSDPAPRLGQRIAVLAVLTPPSGPAEPGAFDFRRYLFYRGIGALGYAIGHWQAVEPTAAAGNGLGLAIDRLRLAMADDIRAGADGDSGAVAAALLTGDRRAVPEPVMDDLRASGLAHLMAISGLHVGLMAGTVFFAVRLGLAAVPALALRYPIKKWAAVAALLAAFVYTVLVGAPVPTQRAFVMTGLALLAILVDRSPISLRLVAWAAAIVLLIAPHSLLEPSFQMSFAAVIGLVAVFERLQQPLTRLRRGGAWAAPLLVYLGAVLLTTLIANLATAPFAAYHFNRLPTYGLAGNLLAVPLTALWIMPCGLVVLIALPLGLEAWPLSAMTLGIDAMLAWAAWIAALPGAVVLVPALPAVGLLAIVAGGLWLALWRDRLRWLGLGVIVVAVVLGLTDRQPADLLVSEDTRLVAVRDEDGDLQLSSTRRGRFVANQWLLRRAQDGAIGWQDGLGTGLACDSAGCLYTRHGYRVALPAERQALGEDCRSADIVVAPFFQQGCAAPVVIDRGTLADYGAHRVTLAPDGIRVERSIAVAGGRPWQRGWGED